MPIVTPAPGPANRYAAFPELGIPISQVPGVNDGGVIEPGFRGSDIQKFRRYYSISTDGLIDNLGAIRDFVRSGLVQSGASANTQQAWASGQPAYNPINAFAANDVTYAAYTQLKFAGEALGIKVDGQIGTRVVITDNILDGTTSQTNSISGVPTTVLSAVRASNRYVDILPNINIQFHLTDRLKLRATRTEAISRPGFNQINPALTIQQGTIGGIVSYTGSGGNPSLQPIRSDNYDASLDYYVSRTGSLPGVSKWSYNLIGLYEKGPVSMRVAYNHRSANVDSYTAPGVFATAYAAPVGRLDLSGSYDVAKNATITVDVANLLKQPYKSYVEAPICPRDVRYEGRIISIGARLRY